MPQAKRKKRKDLRKTILDSTLKEIGRTGIANLTTKVISQSADTSTGIIHHHFDTKDSLVLSAYTQMVKNHRNLMIEARKVHPNSPLDRLKATIYLQFDDNLFPNDLVQVWPQLWANAMHDADVKRLLLIYNKRLLNNIQFDLKQICPTPEEANIRANTIVALVHGLWIERFVIQSTATETCLDTIFSCIRAK